MITTVVYADYLTTDNKKIISSIESKLSETVLMDLTLNDAIDPETEKTCTFKLSDSDGLNEVSAIIDKESIREIITLLREIFAQM